MSIWGRKAGRAGIEQTLIDQWQNFVRVFYTIKLQLNDSNAATRISGSRGLGCARDDLVGTLVDDELQAAVRVEVARRVLHALITCRGSSTRWWRRFSNICKRLHSSRGFGKCPARIATQLCMDHVSRWRPLPACLHMSITRRSVFLIDGRLYRAGSLGELGMCDGEARGYGHRSRSNIASISPPHPPHPPPWLRLDPLV